MGAKRKVTLLVSIDDHITFTLGLTAVLIFFKRNLDQMSINPTVSIDPSLILIGVLFILSNLSDCITH